MCGSEDVRQMEVDMILGERYHEINLDDNPCIIPPCGHVMTMETMDGIMEMSKHYTAGEDGAITAIVDSDVPFSIEELKTCSFCRGPLRTVSRYGRIIRRAFIDESTKKFIVMANRGFVRLQDLIHQQQERFLEPKPETLSTQVVDDLKDFVLAGDRQQQLDSISARVKGKYSPILRNRRVIERYLRQVDIQEQPFKLVWDMVQHARKRERTQGEMAFDPSILQTRQTLLATSLLLRCDMIILSDFLTSWGSGLLDVSFDSNRKDCINLMTSAQEARQPMVEVEVHLFCAQLCLAEQKYSSRPEVAQGRGVEASKHLLDAEELCEKYSGPTRALLGELRALKEMLRTSTFTTVVRDDEWRSVMAAMATEFRGSGHWYTCENGHPFTVGECGMPMQLARCPQCGAQVGGQNHQSAPGVQAATDLEQRFSTMGI
jgi:hypothetical protein